MAVNPLVPNGLSIARSRAGGAATYQNNMGTIAKGYGSAIGRGDLVWRASGTTGYVVLSGTSDIGTLGVFITVYPYLDLTAQQYMHGLNGSYPTSANPSTDIACSIIDDPFVTFMAQVSGGPFVQGWVGQNINFLTGTNGAPNITGQSTLALDGASVNTTATLPFQILGVLGVSGGPQDPANTNPWIEVRLNTAALLAPLGR